MGSTENLRNQSLLIEALEALLSARLGVIEASRAICCAGSALRQDRNPLFKPFVAISSETIQFPLGPERELWASHALAGMDQQREVLERRFGDLATNSAPALLEWIRSQEF